MKRQLMEQYADRLREKTGDTICVKTSLFKYRYYLSDGSERWEYSVTIIGENGKVVKALHNATWDEFCVFCEEALEN